MTRLGSKSYVGDFDSARKALCRAAADALYLFVGDAVEEGQCKSSGRHGFSDREMSGFTPGRIRGLQMDRREVTTAGDAALGQAVHDAIAIGSRK